MCLHIPHQNFSSPRALYCPGIIPQDPVIFSASVRFNLDPFDEHTDAAIWDALSSVDMKVRNLPLRNSLHLFALAPTIYSIDEEILTHTFNFIRPTHFNID